MLRGRRIIFEKARRGEASHKTMFTPKKAATLWNEAVAHVPRRERWTTGLLLVSSAALGGIAVALWNRHTLARMREAAVDSEVTSEQMEFFEYE